MSFKDLKDKVLSWADDKDLLHEENADKQFMKVIEEVFEFKSEFYLRNMFGDNEFAYKDMMLEMGDIFVTLIILCEQIGVDPEECLSMAYEKIKGRSGRTINGNFIKEEDLIDE
ncbi:MazG-like family protein [Anaerococcus sp. AGMB09787]|uniref:MazG-like family protein n=1 Tax=Anaerococcus sp. AGMB09787 TaxID=2922869 RepID=UPI001FB041C9|nr:MazG-like family protein [Anaerococcus sp. AGMB09787]